MKKMIISSYYIQISLPSNEADGQIRSVLNMTGVDVVWEMWMDEIIQAVLTHYSSGASIRSNYWEEEEYGEGRGKHRLCSMKMMLK